MDVIFIYVSGCAATFKVDLITTSMSGQYYNNGAPPSPKCGPVYHMIASDVYPPSPKEMYGTGVYDTIQVRRCRHIDIIQYTVQLHMAKVSAMLSR